MNTSSSGRRATDVLISHAIADTGLAAEVAAACRASGLEAATDGTLAEAGDEQTARWEAVAEGRALLVILSGAAIPSWAYLFMGAFRAWSKPIYGIVTDPSTARGPEGVPEIQLLTPGRLPEVIKAVKADAGQLSDADRRLLAELYAAAATPVDQLAVDSPRLSEIVGHFNKATGKAASGQRVLSEFLRMRKQGALPKVLTARRRRKPDAAPV